MVNDYDLQFLAVENGGTCVGNFQNGNSPGNPSIALQTSGTTCWRNAVDPSKQATCEAPPANSVDRRVCYCIPTVGGGQGDPHIHSLWGARYTLLQQGVFIAWNFTKAVPASAPARCSSSSWMAAPGGLCRRSLHYARPAAPGPLRAVHGDHRKRLRLACPGEEIPHGARRRWSCYWQKMGRPASKWRSYTRNSAKPRCWGLQSSWRWWIQVPKWRRLRTLWSIAGQTITWTSRWRCSRRRTSSMWAANLEWLQTKTTTTTSCSASKAWCEWGRTKSLRLGWFRDISQKMETHVQTPRSQRD